MEDRGHELAVVLTWLAVHARALEHLYQMHSSPFIPSMSSLIHLILDTYELGTSFGASLRHLPCLKTLSVCFHEPIKQGWDLSSLSRLHSVHLQHPLSLLDLLLPSDCDLHLDLWSVAETCAPAWRKCSAHLRTLSLHCEDDELLTLTDMDLLSSLPESTAWVTMQLGSLGQDLAPFDLGSCGLSSAKQLGIFCEKSLDVVLPRSFDWDRLALSAGTVMGVHFADENSFIEKLPSMTMKYKHLSTSGPITLAAKLHQQELN